MGCATGAELARAVVVCGFAVACIGLATGRAAAGVPPLCVGDCAGDGAVSIDDLITGVNIALGIQPMSACSAMDGNGNGTATVDELIRAVTAALRGCPAAPTPSATPTLADTATVPPSLTPTDTPIPTRTETPAPTGTATIPTPVHFCDLPGSVQTTAPGLAIVPGGPPNTPDLSFLDLPVGFCAHFFAAVGNTRQLRFAPGGELFVASPKTVTTGGGPGGQAAIIVLPDDDHDGVADQPSTFLSGLPSTQGLLFAGSYLYYQDRTRIMRVPYAPGDRTAAAPSEQVADIAIATAYTSFIHWPKTLDIADDGTIYVANGGDEGEPCDPTLEPAARPFHGGILELDGSPGGALVAKGFRNPISVRCARGHSFCFAVELTRDFSTAVGGREKILPIRQGDDWGFPCCATTDVPFPDINPVPDCSAVAKEIDSFFVGNTPFDLDFEFGKWPEPWSNQAYVPLHGAYGSWSGARVVAIDFDTMTGQVLPGSDLTGTSTGAMKDFATGWDDDTRSHGRPAVVAFAPDGRLFLGSDTTGVIIWIAPLGL